MKLSVPKRFTLLKGFVLLFLAISLLLRVIFLIWNFSETDHALVALATIFLTGLFYDIGTVSFFALVGALYFLAMPKKFIGSLADRMLCYTGFTLGVLIIFFSFFAEITFWDEFQRRFNFIAVDYLIYTYEVVKNINESYPLPILIGGMGILVVVTVLLFKKFGLFKSTFESKAVFKIRLVPSVIVLGVAVIFALFIKNESAELSENRYNNEISKAGIYSFFAAFRNNELSYPEFYKTEPIEEAFLKVNDNIKTLQDSMYAPASSINRYVTNDGEEKKPNVIFICIESLSAKYLGAFGNPEPLTPTLDSLTQVGLSFDNLFATGTRTVRGMEAITLSIPPTPGRSIVKREKNNNLFTIGEVFETKGYTRTFFYGGDGYFDNMDKYFSSNGFDIVDRGRGFLPTGDIVTTRKNIEDDEVTFENAWGVCDGDIYRKVLKEADLAFETGKPFFDFIMTTSNHKPYTYPDHKIDIPSGTGRNGAVRYTDYAIQEFLKSAKQKPWFKNTVFVIMADHCASSAGRWELDVANYHIPTIIVNLENGAQEHIKKLCSQIDVFPTLFAQLGWRYESNLFGKDVMKMGKTDERAFIGNYRKLGLLKGSELMVLGDQKQANFYQWNSVDNSLQSMPMNDGFLKETISYFQVADYLYSNNGLTLKASK
ncbi:phosphoglycerol transferase MdoB-like AlkP superfamily enzyme [Gelidibacter algens]|uniref:Phosphoglycerol transferase MdoB-like AlkP superfamily enzyme n=1 Tax=Gelidibacter algens TaxID=49280 RepID=A0A1A7R0Q9_9FLAO|nr:LTA synthase family protein [Gelidibacter algens]OBX25406.1 sulfatase [Gelidibacter algens]RAJ24696.1 phosphoglycerol transferase MdoB-like AlkP superfamily enzyme [Gelidibacter algens]